MKDHIDREVRQLRDLTKVPDWCPIKEKKEEEQDADHKITD